MDRMKAVAKVCVVFLFQGSSTRKSLRIKKKQSRVFRKPKKADVFNAIPSLSETDKSMSEYRPRKLVTDFTKV